METATELKAMLVDYAKQETVGPLKALGKWVAFGLAGAICVVIGVVFWSFALLRLLQSETDALDGGLSFLPYVITLVTVLIAMAVFAALAFKGTSDDGSQ